MSMEEFLVMDRKHISGPLAAMLWMQGLIAVLDSISAINSSPLTAERYGADPTQAASAMEYTYHGMIVSGFYASVAGLVAHSWWPLIGVVPADAYMWWLYKRAIGRAVARGPVDWSGLGG